MRRAALAVAFLCAAVSVTFLLYEPDMWQHLRVGRAIWETRSIPITQLWTWPTHGAPDVNPSWGFRALIHPFWSLGGVWGLFAWRWLTTLSALALLFAAARRMGAGGYAPLVAVAIAALAWRDRSQIRPETLVAVLVGVEIWILETRRQGGPDRILALVPLAVAWINCHVSWPLGFAILGAYALRDGFDRSMAVKRRIALPAVALGGLAASLLNPFGIRALELPFEFFAGGRAEPIYVTIGELQPIRWSENLRNAAPLVVFGWPLLILWRASRRRADLVEILLCALFTPLAVGSVRFLGFLALVSLPFLARGLAELAAATRLGPRPEALRAAATGALCVALSLPAWVEARTGVGIDWSMVPVRACDFIERAGIRGRAYNTFSAGGYLLHRFWPDEERLPFMDIHQAGTREARRLYTFSLERSEYWAELDSTYRFDWALLMRRTFDSNRLPDFLDSDPGWALVFMDDVALVLVRRDRRLAEVAARHAFRVLPAGNERLAAVGEACARDSALRAALRADLERAVAESERHANAEELLASLALLEGRSEEAVAHLRRAVAADPEDRERREMLRAIESGR